MAVQALGPLLGAGTHRTSVGALSWKKAQGLEGQLANCGCHKTEQPSFPDSTLFLIIWVGLPG